MAIASTELGECEVKHGLRISLLNLYNTEVGNPELPEKLRQAKNQTAPGAVRADEGFWVAVLPFKYSGNNADLTALAEGLSEEIVTGLSRFSYLRVIARGSTAKYSNEAGDIRAIGKELGARYVMEGSLRQAGDEAAHRSATRGCEFRRPSVGGLRPPLQPGSGFRPAGQTSFRGSSPPWPIC